MLEPGHEVLKPPTGSGIISSSAKKDFKLKPLLYTTPQILTSDPTPLLDSPLSFPPSPYIVNHKRRGPNLGRRLSNSHVLVNKVEVREEMLNVRNGEELMIKVGRDKEKEGDMSGDDFYEPGETASVTSNVEVEESSGDYMEKTPSTPMGEFFDACEELSSGGALQASPNEIETELREIRLNLLAEIERRKQAEEALKMIYMQWENIRQQLALVGLILPPAPIVVNEEEKTDADPAEDLCRQIQLARLVFTSIARAAAKAEVELEMESQLELKNVEVARLSDRLNYYEAVNHEMSQRNQETVDMARHDRQKRKQKQKWVWSSIGVAIALGSAALAWSYIPSSKGLSPPSKCELPSQT